MEGTGLTRDELDKISRDILGGALSVHREMGPGLLESVYHHCLEKELRSRNLKVDCYVPVPLFYKGDALDKMFYVDMLIEDSIVIELKSIECILPVHEAQLLSYLRLTSLKLGFLINFNEALLKDGFKRLVNNF